MAVTDPADRRLLEEWQRDFPVIPQPFARLARVLDTTEADVIARLRALQAEGAVSRVGATCPPNTVSASTLAAIAAPPGRVDDVARIINAEPGVNHSYERSDRWNLWFVATGPDRAHVDAALSRIAGRTGLRVLDLRLVRAFNVDLGFRLWGNAAAPPPPPRDADPSVLRPGDRDILNALTRGLEVTARPYAALASELGQSEAQVLGRIRVLLDAGLISRLGVILHHRRLGWNENAMVVWDLTPAQITETGPLLAAEPGITLCYERRPVAESWPYRLYAMIHAQSRKDARAVLTRVRRRLPHLRDAPHKVLFSTRCFRQRGALIAAAQPEPAR